jgi:hypothetical protein
MMNDWTDGQLIAVAILIAAVLISRALRGLPVGLATIARLIMEEWKKTLNK